MLGNTLLDDLRRGAVVVIAREVIAVGIADRVAPHGLHAPAFRGRGRGRGRGRVGVGTRAKG